jgi:hypothetical protein
MSTGKIGSADLAAGTDTDLTAGGVAENMVANVCMVNRGAAIVKVRLAIGTGTGPAAGDYLEYDAQLPPNGVIERTGLAVSTGEKIFVRTDIATVSVRAHGLPAA